jgi:heptosyltransferase-3
VRGTDALPGLLDVSGQLSMPQVRALLQHADAYLGPDTSVTHLASAVGVPIVTLFGPTNPQDFGPWPHDHPATQPWQRRAGRQQVGNIVVLQGPDLPGRTCVPCNRMGCEHRHDSASHCLLELAPERVLSELRLMLERERGAGPSLCRPGS